MLFEMVEVSLETSVKEEEAAVVVVVAVVIFATMQFHSLLVIL
jgi:hypothetical protein